MKYKVGDKVKIKTWKEMEKEYGVNSFGAIEVPYKDSNIRTIGFSSYMEKFVKNLNNNRIITIKEVCKNIYDIENSTYIWTDNMIECLASEYIEPEPVKSRFELLIL